MESLGKKMTGATAAGSKKKLGRFLKEQRARLYIIRRCVVLLLCSHDHDS